MIFKKFKYVVFDEVFPRITGEYEKHSELADGRKVTSAGFGQLVFEPDGEFYIQCWGESVGLNVKSRPEKDAVLLRMLFVEY